MKFLQLSIWIITFLFYPYLAVAQTTIGWLEPVSLKLDKQKSLELQAKIDSGADNSSLHAEHITFKTVNGIDWVTFKTGDNLVFTAPVIKQIAIKTKTNGLQKRPVISVLFCMHGIQKQIEVNLVNRAHFSTKLLVGRSALNGFLIDVSKVNQTDINKCQSILN